MTSPDVTPDVTERVRASATSRRPATAWLWPLPAMALAVGLWVAWRTAPVAPGHLLRLAGEARPVWLAAALLAQALHFAGYELLFAGSLRAVGVRGPVARWTRMLPRVLAWTAADRAMPLGGIGGGAAMAGILATDAPPNRVRPSRTVAAIGLAYAVDYVVFAALALLTLTALACAHALTRGEATAVLALVGVIGVAAVGIAVALRRQARFGGRFLRPLSFAAHVVRRRPAALVPCALGCLVREAGDALTLVAACRAFGIETPLPALAAVYVLSGTIALVSFIPQGIGVIEASTAVLLRGFGAPPAAALGSALLFRGVSYWLPIPLGLAAGAAIRRGALRGGVRQGVREGAPGRRLLGGLRLEARGFGTLGVHMAAVLAGAVGLINVMSALLPRIPWRARLISEVLPVHVAHAGRTLIVFLGFALVYFAAQLWRRKRRAWQIVLAMLVASVVLHLVKGLDYEEAAICMLGIALLWGLRREFRAGHDPASLRHSFAIVALSAAGVAVYALAGFALLHGKFGGSVGGRGDWLRAAWWWFFTFDDNSVIPLTHHARWFVRSVDTLGIAALGTALLALSKPWGRIRAATEAERREVQALLVDHGRTDLCHFCLLPDKTYYWNEARTGVIAYKLVGNVALALGDPVAPDAAVCELVAGFAERCLENDWRPAFYQVTPRFAWVAVDAGFSLLKVGEDAVVDLEAFTLEGSAAKAYRQTINALERQGVTVECYDLAKDPRGITQELSRISDAWLHERKGSEKTFSLGYFDPELLKGLPLMVAFGPDGRPVGFENLVPMYAAGGYAGDMNRWAPDAPRRLAEYIILKTALWLQEHGYRWYGQGLAPLATMGDPTQGARPHSERAVALLYRHFGLFYGFLGLRTFKQKFGPQWESRYLAYPGHGLLPKVVAAIIRADSRGGLVEYLRRG